MKNMRRAVADDEVIATAQETSPWEDDEIVWDIKQNCKNNTKDDLSKQRRAIKRALKKQDRCIWVLLDQPLPTIHESVDQPTFTKSGDHLMSPSILCKSDHTSCQGYNKPSMYACATPAWGHSTSATRDSTKHPTASSSACTNSATMQTASVSTILGEKKKSRIDSSEIKSNVPFELEYLRWSQRLSRISFSYAIS